MTAIRNPPAALLEASTSLSSNALRSAGRSVNSACAIVKRDQSLNEALAHVGVYRGGSLASADHLGGAEIHGHDFCVGAAEIDE